MTARRPGWYVVCAAYQRGPFRSAEIAQRELERVRDLSGCLYEHQVEKVASQ